MFQFNDRMVEIKRAQNLNSRSKQAQAQVADKSIRGRVANCQVNGRGARPHGMGRGMQAVGPGGRGTMRMGQGRGAVGMVGRGGFASNSSDPHRGAPSAGGPFPGGMPPAQVGGGAGGGGGGRGPPGASGRGGNLHSGFGPVNARAGYEPGSGASAPRGRGGWVPGMTPEQMMAAGFGYFYPMYPTGRGGGMVPPQPPSGPYAPAPWVGVMDPQMADSNGMTPPFFPGAAHPGYYFVPPGMDLAQMGMDPQRMFTYGVHPGFPQHPDWDESQGREVEDDGVGEARDTAADVETGIDHGDGSLVNGAERRDGAERRAA